VNDKFFFVGLSFIFVFFFVTYFLSGGTDIEGRMGVGRDYQFHLANARNESKSYPFIEQHFLEYPPLFKWLSAPFGFQEKVFYFFTLFFLCLLTPLVLWFLFKDFFLVIGYFFVSNLVFVVDIIGSYPQILLSLLLCYFVLQKNWFVRLVLVLFSLFVHRWGWAALMGYWCCEIIVKEVLIWKQDINM